MGCRRRAIVRRAILTTSFLVAGISLRGAPSPSAVPERPDDPTIVHVLNRLGFGPRPGDVERVRTAGVAAYIEQQLHPERIPDAQMATRLAPLSTLDMSARQVASDYFIPATQAGRAAR